MRAGGTHKQGRLSQEAGGSRPSEQRQVEFCTESSGKRGAAEARKSGLNARGLLPVESGSHGRGSGSGGKLVSDLCWLSPNWLSDLRNLHFLVPRFPTCTKRTTMPSPGEDQIMQNVLNLPKPVWISG